MTRLVLPAILLLLAACAQEEAVEVSGDSLVMDETALQTLMLKASPGDVIEVPAGRITFKRALSLNVDGVTLRGAGMDRTVLDFSGQVQGAEGLLVTASDFTIEDIAIEDAKGDALKINEGRNIVIRRVRTEWTSGPNPNNGAYGIYPVQTENTLIEESVAIGASDAGIYVGQSRNVVVRNNRAEYNVAGIEIENTIDADVYDNVAMNNTGGILVFNMPQLSQEGKNTRVYNNRIENNNTGNFAAPGGAVAGLPTGTGISINSNDLVEVFDNDLIGNLTAHIIVSSVYSTNYSGREAAEGFDPYPETIFIHGNRYAGGGTAPGTEELAVLKDTVFGKRGAFPNVIWDGYAHPERLVDGVLPPELQICIDNEASTAVLNADSANGFASPVVNEAEHACRHEPLPAVNLALAE